MTRLEIFVPCGVDEHGKPRSPQTKGSMMQIEDPRTGRRFMRHGGNKAHAKRIKQWTRRIKTTVRQWYTGPLLTCPVSIHCDFVFPRPKNHFRTGKYKHVLRDDAPLYVAKKKGPDNDKLSRLAWDALTDIVYDDDGRIAVDSATAKYQTGGVEWLHEPGVRIVLEEL